MHIYARTKAATDAVVSDIEKVISEYLMDKVLDQPQDQQHIAKLTERQVMLSFIACLLLNTYMVITLNSKYNVGEMYWQQLTLVVKECVN